MMLEHFINAPRLAPRTSGLALNQPGFVLANARALARASQAAYMNAGQASSLTVAGASLPRIQGGKMPPEPADKMSAPHFHTGSDVVSYHNARTGTHVLITAYEDCTVIAFRGTASLRDWLTDAEFPLRPLPSSGPAPRASGLTPHVHEGFLTAIDSVLPDILAYLAQPRAQSPEPKASPLFLTGHSLGGALAVLCAWFLRQEGFAIHSVYTFGQPRVGDRSFANAYADSLGDRTFRVVNQNDVVPRVPGVLLGYHHAGQTALLNALGGLMLNPSGFWLLASDLLGLYRAWRRLDDALITDHFMDRYLAALSNSDLIAGTDPVLVPPQAPHPAPRA